MKRNMRGNNDTTPIRRGAKSGGGKIKLILALALAVLVIALAVIIIMQAKQTSAERGEATQSAQVAEMQAAEEQAAAEKAAEEQAAREAEEAKRVEEERAKRAAEAAQYSFYQKLAKGYDTKMLIMGDSVIDGTGASSESTTWFALLQEHIEKTYYLNGEGAFTIENAAGKGHSLFPDLLSVKDGDLAADCDVAVLCYGNEDPKADFSAYFEALTRAIHLKNPDSAIIFVLESTEGGHTERMVYVENTCAYYSIPVADTFGPYYALGEKEFFNAFADAVHPNDKGQQIYFEVMRDVIDENVTADTGKMQDMEPFSGDSGLFDNLKYIPASDFTRDGDLTYTIPADAEQEIRGVLMLDCGYPVSRETAKVIADDILYTLPRGEAIHDTVNGDRYLFTVYRDFIFEKSLNVIFTEKSYADEFSGVYLMWPTPKEK